MATDTPNGDRGDGRSARPRRRTRYAGTHPRRFDQRYKELNPDSYPEIQRHIRAQGRTPAGTHVPVLIGEVLAALRPVAGSIVVDCTIGYGGHAGEIIKHIGPTGRLIGLDVDAVQLQRTAQRLGGAIHDQANRMDTPNPPKINLHRCHFAGIGKILAREQLDGCDIILADLGASSMQLDDPTRGFSYKYDGPLDMRMDDRLDRTATDLLATLSVDELAANLDELGDEPDYGRIARAIVQHRAIQPITQTRQLVRLILAVKQRVRPAPREGSFVSAGERHPAARTFQVLRMLVNDEMGGLLQFLRVAPYCLRAGGRLGIVSFHSGEHERVQHAFREGFRSGLFAVISTEPIRPTAQEIGANPRSRSARLHWARRGTF